MTNFKTMYVKLPGNKQKLTSGVEDSVNGSIQQADLRNAVQHRSLGEQGVNFSHFVSMCSIGLHQSRQPVICLHQTASECGV